jgi:phosphoribosylformylglycinamidine cyclo-ligase
MKKIKDKLDYKSAGVDVDRGYRTVELIKEHAHSTQNERVLAGLGGFGAMFDIKGLGGQNPVLVAATDGVGTKLKYAEIFDKHDTIGIDCVAMCANDIVCQGAQPLFFLDYIAQSRIKPNKVAQVVKGMAQGCKQAGMSLIGGETAEMPGYYNNDKYDVAGFCVGIVDKSHIIDGSLVESNDVVIGLASSGLHSNAFSLVRKLFGHDKDQLLQFESQIGNPLAQELLKPTVIYVDIILELIKKYKLKGISHITGGGWIENLPRMLPSDKCIVIDKIQHFIPPIFNFIKTKSKLDDKEMYNTFNMGIGMAFSIDCDIVDQVLLECSNLGHKAYVIGKIQDKTDEQSIKFV